MASKRYLQRLHSGASVDVTALVPEDVQLLDIAHALSLQCRYGGQCAFHYSVALHSVFVAERVFAITGDTWRARAALMHDAAEAYLTDLPRPLKYLPQMEFYRALENSTQRMIMRSFGLPASDDLVIRRVDDECLVLEALQLFDPPLVANGYGLPLAETIDWRLPKLVPIQPRVCSALFMTFWAEPNTDVTALIAALSKAQDPVSVPAMKILDHAARLTT